MAGSIRKLFLAVGSRGGSSLDPRGDVQIYSTRLSGGYQFGTPPSRDGTLVHELDAGNADYEVFLGGSYKLRTTSPRADFGPRFAFLWGEVQLPGQSNWRDVPLYHSYTRAFVGEWLGADGAFWDLQSVAHGASDQDVGYLLLYLKTRDWYWGWSEGPFELTVFGEANGTAFMAYQTMLLPVGRNKAAPHAGGQYFLLRPLHSGTPIRADRLTSAMITNLSDDAWTWEEAYLFGLNTGMDQGRLLGKAVASDVEWISQDQHDGATSLRVSDGAKPAVEIPLGE